MSRTYYLPKSDKERALWYKTFNVKIPTYATALGLTALDLTSMQNDSAALNYQLEVNEIFRKEQLERTAYKNTLRDGPIGTVLGPMPSVPALPVPPVAVAAGIIPRLIAMVNRIRSHPAYTESMGKDLGIIGSEPVQDFVAQQPTLRLSKDAGAVVIKYRRGSNDGAHIYCKRSDETKFTMLIAINKNSYYDTRPNLVPGQPEKREYQAWFTVADEVRGQVSQTAEIVV